jgi:hypothetical protein
MSAVIIILTIAALWFLLATWNSRGGVLLAMLLLFALTLALMP